MDVTFMIIIIVSMTDRRIDNREVELRLLIIETALVSTNRLQLLGWQPIADQITAIQQPAHKMAC